MIFCVEELKNSRTGGYDTEIARKEQARKKIYKQRAEHFKELQSFWENVFPAKYSVCKTTQTQQKEEIGSKHLPNVCTKVTYLFVQYTIFFFA